MGEYVRGMVRGSLSRRIIVCVAVIFLIGSIVPLFSEEAPGGEIVYAEGREFSIVRSGVPQSYSLAEADVVGLRLEPGDFIQTGARTFVEVQLFPKGTVLKLAENSSFVFKDLGPAGESVSLGLIYGRVRAKVAKLSGNESFSIRSGTTVAGVRGTDFGFDSIARPATEQGASVAQPAVRVYCFSGAVSVFPVVTEDEPKEDSPAVLIKADELVSIDLSSPLPIVEKAAVDRETKAYWGSHDFKGETTLPAPETAPLAVAPSPTNAEADADEEIRYTEADYIPYLKALNAKNTAIGASIFFATLGIGMQAAGFYEIHSGHDDFGSHLVVAGSISGGMAAVSLISGLLVNTPSP